ncbi:DUF805 domain-containing protein [Ignatzschineria rhizosphaerae]|uniref:DUF805 domain-containing protein n=1 Tax=Ignatzschineria rhizosphaerae TaxID=2923279 RepID=A0ABY3X327_9GAMM|nr:DUF805 domain-containing protein [Ignatzschineria rhizosphaerae]UNM97283.1 DUF805 domain-containing protein [Ignatzschineria rhizosphaerae]
MSKQPQANLQKAPSYFSFGFTGRIGRLEFANRFVTYLLLIITIYLLYYFAIEQGLFLLFDGNDKSTDMTRGLIKLIFHAGLFGTALLLNIRMAIMRLHDLNLSGWWTCLIFTIPYIAALFVVMLPMTLNMTLYHTIFYIVAIIAIIAQLIPFLMPGNAKSNHYGTPTKTGKPIGACLLLVLIVIGGYFLYQYITLQSISIIFLQNLQS